MPFSLVPTAVGALFIQLATTSYYHQTGRTVGFSSALFNTFKAPFTSAGAAIVAGTALGGAIVSFFFPYAVPAVRALAPLSFVADSAINSLLNMSLAGFLVGLGTRYGSGCTSGHMLCGLSRLRIRSLVATMSFSATAMLTLFLSGLQVPDVPVMELSTGLYALLAACGVLTYTVLRKVKLGDGFAGLYSGMLFGIGLCVSGMADPAKTLGFLNLQDLSLILIMVFAVLPNTFTWPLTKLPLSGEWHLATSNDIDAKLVLGSAVFGVGWGLMGVCPGPATLALLFNTKAGLFWMGSFALGYYL